MKIRNILASAAVAGLAVFSAAAPALASDNAQAGMLTANFQCNGATQNAASQDTGFINVHQTDATHVDINYHLKGAAPDNTYEVFLYTGFCTFDTTLGLTVTTNGNGVANANFQDVSIPAGATQLFVLGFDVTPFTGLQGEAESVAVPLG